MRDRTPIMARALILLVRGYQATLSPFMGGHCRFEPSCSRYAIDALRHHGAARGGWLALRRVCRCHPLGGSGYDPAPPPRPHAASPLKDATPDVPLSDRAK